MTQHPKQTTDRKRRHYTTGDLNKIIDALLHPLAKNRPEVLMLDGILHSLNEQNPRESLLKFIRYNAPEILKHLKRRK